MHRIPLAHAFCNGLIKAFWNLMSRPESTVLKVGNDIRLTKAQIAKIKEKVKELRGTTCFTGSLPDIIRCALAATTPCTRKNHLKYACCSLSIWVIVLGVPT